jgi:3-hydroxyethyl bacteriochlorophyllide a dehydrogenase
MKTTAVVFDRPGALMLRELALQEPTSADVVVETAWSGVSAGTERLLFRGEMPAFPGLGYPLVPGYESVGRVVRAGAESGFVEGDHVFVPGARCFPEARCLFGGTARHLVVHGTRAAPVPATLGADAALFALAATAFHIVRDGDRVPDLVVGHGALGRLVARIIVALGHPRPTVWERQVVRRGGDHGYPVVDPDADAHRGYQCIVDVSGDAKGLNHLITRLAPRGELVLGGFYTEALSIDFAPAFMRRARMRVAAEWEPEDLAAVTALVADETLSLDGIVSHRASAADAPLAYQTAFESPECVKLVLDWSTCA